MLFPEVASIEERLLVEVDPVVVEDLLPYGNPRCELPRTGQPQPRKDRKPANGQDPRQPRLEAEGHIVPLLSDVVDVPLLNCLDELIELTEAELPGHGGGQETVRVGLNSFHTLIMPLFPLLFSGILDTHDGADDGERVRKKDAEHVRPGVR